MSSDFYDDMIKGGTIKGLVKALLEKSGYLVFPYGYESTFSHIVSKLSENDAKDSPTARRLKSSPDILVYDDQRKDVMLVEVKMRRAPNETRVAYLKIERYKEFWSDCILVVVIPCGDVLYAQKVSELENKQYYNVTTDFERFQDVFRRVSAYDISSFRSRALQIMKSEER